MSNNRVKTINDNKSFYYKDITYYIKNENTKIQKIQNPITKNIYKEIIEHGSKQHKVAGEMLWKKLIPKTQNFKTFGKILTYPMPFCKDLHFKILHYSTKTNEYMHKCTHEVKPNCDYCKQVEDNTSIRYTPKNQSNLGKLSTHFNKTD